MESVSLITPEEAILIPWAAMGEVREGERYIYLFLGDRMARAPWDPESGEEKVKAVLSIPVVYFIIHNLGNDEYGYESGVASSEGMQPLVMARVHLAYLKGEAMA